MALLASLLDDAADGVASPLERRWRRDVEVAHGLPQGRRNRAEVQGGRQVYRDLVYPAYDVVVELDGAIAHPAERWHLDRARDRALVEASRTTLRYGWHELAGDPCACAGQVGRILAVRGWGGTPRACGVS